MDIRKGTEVVNNGVDDNPLHEREKGEGAGKLVGHGSGIAAKEINSRGRPPYCAMGGMSRPRDRERESIAEFKVSEFVQYMTQTATTVVSTTDCSRSKGVATICLLWQPLPWSTSSKGPEGPPCWRARSSGMIQASFCDKALRVSVGHNTIGTFRLVPPSQYVKPDARQRIQTWFSTHCR